MEPQKKHSVCRRDFIKTSAMAGTALISGAAFVACVKSSPKIKGLQIVPKGILGQLKKKGKSSLLPDAITYIAENPGDGLDFYFPKGTLADKKFITADMLLDGANATNFRIELQEGEKGPVFGFQFSCLSQCGLRVRMPLNMVDMNRWGIEREGAFLKPRCSGDRVNLKNVDHMRFIVYRKNPDPIRFSITEIVATKDDVPLITEPILPKGPLLDELGQSTIHQWPDKTKTINEMSARLQKQLKEAPSQKWPDTFTRWGGQTKNKLTKGSGFFKTHHDSKRWWLVDPDGYAFWSAGLDCVMVDTAAAYTQLESALTFLPSKEGDYADIFNKSEWANQTLINYLAANFIRTFGPEGWRKKWAEIALSELRRMRLNTVGNWSEWKFASEVRFPYVRPMEFKPAHIKLIYRDFPDVFHPEFALDTAEYALTLKETVNDPALIGYFMMNEPQWGFSKELPSVGMMFNTPDCETRKALSQFLKDQYKTDQALSNSWGLQTTFDAISSGIWESSFSEAALRDMESFSSVMADKYFTTLSEACRKVDPNHLNLGIRYAGVPPEWVAKGMKAFDVFSINSYTDKVPKDITEKINKMLGLPTIIGEWHFGALDVGLPFSGIGHLKNQSDRAKAYRIYFEDAAANPNCVGVHWFTLYDESALGREDGEAYNIGFLDVCNRPYSELSQASIQSHERMYDLTNGKDKPFDEVIEYLPKLY
jgi:hypothetical protein